MKTKATLITLGLASVIVLSAVTTPVFAWKPKGVIIKQVQNVTTGSVLSDADTTASAIAAKPGDTLKYVIEVRNDGTPDSSGHNDMAKTVLKDTLPTGVELVSQPSMRQITENLGVLKPGQKVTKEYLVKVTATKNGPLTNTACFTGDSKADDNPQSGCNPAVVTVTVPTSPETPVTPTTPETPAPTAPTELPHTGIAENTLLSAFILAAVWYSLHRYFRSKRALTNAFLNS